jgi:hypothetical protein
MITFISFLLLSWPSHALFVDASACSRGLAAQDLRAAQLALGHVVAQGFDPSLPNNGSPDVVFRNHFDWHSSVHAYWALLEVTRLQAQAVQEKLLLRHLDGHTLQRVATHLREDSKFELPYGQAWFIELLDEAQKHPLPVALKKQFYDLENETAARVLADLKSSAAQTDDDYQSWLMAAFLLSRAQSLKATHALALKKLIESRKTLLTEQRSQLGFASTDFFSASSVASLLLKQPPPSYVQLSPDELVQRLKADENLSGHNAGFLATELWAKAAQIQKVGRVACEDYVSSLNKILVNPTLWQQDFMRIAHWVPQFLLMSTFIAVNE